MNKIDELKVGSVIVDTFLLSEASIRPTKGNPPRNFMNVTLNVQDRSIGGVMWNIPETMVVPEIGKVYIVNATVGDYMGKKQLTLANIVLNSNQDLTDFVPSVGIPSENLRAILNSLIAQIDNENLYHITRDIYDRYMDEILVCTAAKSIHHMGVGGLALHSIEVAENGIGIYEANPDLGMSKSLIIAGALLHDIGKILTYKSDGAVIDYTENGTMFDHIIGGILILSEYNAKTGCMYNTEIELLQHIIASHHGALEHGSPVTPKFMEAFVIHHADVLSTVLCILKDATRRAGDNNMTEKLYTLGNHPHFSQAYISSMTNGVKYKE